VKKKIKFQPGHLGTRRYFQRHFLDERFECPFPQSIITALESFSSDDIDNSFRYCDTAEEIICYDFKEQALDLIQYIDLWENLDNFIGTVDQENPFSGKSPRQDGLLDA